MKDTRWTTWIILLMGLIGLYFQYNQLKMQQEIYNRTMGTNNN